MWRRNSNFRRATIVTSLVLLTTPLMIAPAVTPEGECLMGQVCVWSAPGYAGQKHTVPGQIGICQGMPFDVRSMKHNSAVLPRPIFLASSADSCGQILPTIVLPGSQLSNINPPFRSLIGT
jgi:hypothetical protein